MTIHDFHTARATENVREQLNQAEEAMPLAPCVELDNGQRCIPQHYLLYRQTVGSVSEILHDIEPIEDVMLFCGHDEGGLYLQAGMLGPDNYRRTVEQQRRLVYGRKWRIETYTPTSEVIQTALLAVKKACEHEVRELFTLRDSASNRTGTPFSTHHDLPLMARYPELVLPVQDAAAEPPAQQWLEGAQFAGRDLLVHEMAVRPNGDVVVDLSFGELGGTDDPHSRYGIDKLTLTVVLRAWHRAALLHATMNALIQHSDSLIDEGFRYRGFARFSKALHPLRIAQLSLATRTRGLPHGAFEPVRKALNFEVDAKRVPSLGAGKLAARNRQILEQRRNWADICPMTLRQVKIHAKRCHDTFWSTGVRMLHILDDSILVLIDFQPRLMPAIHDGEAVMAQALRLARIAQLLDVPIIGTEQNRHGLGECLPDIQAMCSTIVTKHHFDACADGLVEALPAGRRHVIVAGCEAHVCVLQTAFGLLNQGMTVTLLADAVGSRKPLDRDTAIARLAKAGAGIATVEMVAFEWLRSSHHPRFRDALRLIK